MLVAHFVRRSLIAFGAAVALGCSPQRMDTRPVVQPPLVTLLVVNARVWTGDPRRPWADAVAVRGERLELVGSSAEVRKLDAMPGARVIDAGGAMLVPGFIDTHVHLIDGGFRLASVQLRDARSPAEFTRRIRDFAATVPAGTWITGGDWDHTLWGGALPERAWVDSVSPDHPVWVSRLDGHMALANTAALKAAGLLTSRVADVQGGSIARDARGEPAGVFRDNAMALVDRVVPDPPAMLADRALDAALAYVAERGITSLHHMGGWGDLAVLERAHVASRLTARVYAALPLASWERLRDTIAARGRGDNMLRIGGLKGYVDGSLGSHTALMLEAYSDAPADLGLQVTPTADLLRWSIGADAAGLQLMVHAIGDRANQVQLDIFEQVARTNPARDRRHRIEHAQHLDPNDIPRFGRLGVIPSMQPYHAIDDGRWATRVIGYERAKGAYAFQSLLATGARLAFGSDWFVAPPAPLEGIYAAVTRRTLDGANPNGWVPDQKITVEEALRAYTLNGAWASFEEGQKGSLERGKLADFVLLDRDITRVPVDSLRDARVMITVVGGRIVYERPR